MSLNMELTKLIREIQHESEAATHELIRVCNRYELSEGGTEMERQRLYAAVVAAEAQAETRAAELIDTKIAELDAKEIRTAEQRAKDTGYLERLQMKINMIGSVDQQKLDDATLAAMFSEFTDDPVAVELIRAAIPGGRAVKIVPENNTGALQKHLKDMKTAVLRALKQAASYTSPADLENGKIPFKGEVDALTAYIMAQDESFSKDDAAVWESVVQSGKASDVDAWLWQTRFHN